MEPMTYTEWCATEKTVADPVRRWQRYEAYCAGVAFIRTQIGGFSAAMAEPTVAMPQPSLAGGQ